MTAIVKYDNANKISVGIELFGEGLITEFITSRCASKATAKTYRNAIRQLQKFCAVNNINLPTTEDLELFNQSLRDAHKSDSTRRLYATVVKSYFSFLSSRNYYMDIISTLAPLKIRKTSTHKKNALTAAQAKALLNSVQGDSIIAKRDKAIIGLALCSGLRTCEISRANISNLRNVGDCWLLDVVGKGHLTADSSVKIPKPVADLILSYLDLRGGYDSLKDINAPLFASTSNNKTWSANSYGERLAEQTIGKMIKSRLRSIGINDRRITAHSTRHFCATQAIRNGCDLREVSQMLRHSSLNITLTYLHDISLENRRAELSVAESLFGGAA